MNPARPWRVLIATEKDLDPRRGKGVAAWARDLQAALEAAGHPCWLLGSAGREPPWRLIYPSGDGAARARFLAALVRAEGIDVVLAASSQAAFLAWPQLPAPCLRIPTVHAALWRTVRREAAAAPVVHGFVGISAIVSARLRATLGATRPVFAVPNGLPAIPAAVAPQAARPPLVLVVGRLEAAQKRSHWLPRIVQALAGHAPEARVHAFGDGPLAPWLKEFAAASGGRLEVHAPVPGAELLARLAEARVLLVTSAYEGLSIAMLEAMAHGAVVVAPRLEDTMAGLIDDANARLVTTSSGLTLSDREAAAFGTAVATVLADAAAADRLAAAARQTLQLGHTMPRVVERYLGVFERLRGLPEPRFGPPVPLGAYAGSRHPLARLWQRAATAVGVRAAIARERLRLTRAAGPTGPAGSAGTRPAPSVEDPRD